MREELAGASVWGTLFVGITLLGASVTAAPAAPALGVAAATAILGNIAASKLQHLVDAFHEHRARTGEFGGRIDSNQDEAKAIRVVQLSALRSFARATRPRYRWMGNNRRRQLCISLERWAVTGMSVSDAAIEQALHKAAPQTLALLTGTTQRTEAFIRANDLKSFVEHSVWAEAKEALTIWEDETDEDVAWLKSAFLSTDAGWFVLFTLQWQSLLKNDPKVSAIVQHIQQALLHEKVDAIKSDTDAILSNVEALPEVLTAALNKALEERGIITEAKRRGLSDVQVHRVLAAFGKNGLPPDQWKKGLLDSAERLRDLETRLSVMSNEEPEIAALTQAAGAAIKEGDFIHADALLAEAEQLDIDASLFRLRRAAETRFKRGELARSQQDFWTAGQHFEAAADLIKTHSPILEASWLHWAGIAFLEHGMLFPGPSLDRAVVSFRNALGLITIKDKPNEWAITQNDLGAALQLQGERTEGKAGLDLLAESVTACHASLEVFTEKTTPDLWAMTQNNLSNTLRVLGERTAGNEGLDLLAKSVTASRAALEVSTREAAPSSWAGKQNSLSNTLRIQGERTRGKAGLDLLAESVTACRAALEVFTEKKAPAQWAMTQNNLGNAYMSQGRRTEGQAGLDLLADSVTAYRAALTVRTFEAMPIDWALGQSNLGNALRVLGERVGGEVGLKLLADSVLACRAALRVRTHETMAVDWAFAQENIALAALARFKISAEVIDLKTARDAADAAMTVYGAGGMDLHADKCAQLLADIVALSG